MSISVPGDDAALAALSRRCRSFDFDRDVVDTAEEALQEQYTGGFAEQVDPYGNAWENASGKRPANRSSGAMAAAQLNSAGKTISAKLPPYWRFSQDGAHGASKRPMLPEQLEGTKWEAPVTEAIESKVEQKLGG